MTSAAQDPAVLALLRNPFSLTPSIEGPRQPLGNKPMIDEMLGLRAAPFTMAAINNRNMHPGIEHA